MADVLATVEPRIKRLLDRRGLGEGDDQGSGSDAWADEAPVLAGLFDQGLPFVDSSQEHVVKMKRPDAVVDRFETPSREN